MSLKKNVDDNASMSAKLRALQEESDVLRKGNSESGLKITKITQEYSMKITTYENRINQYNLEVEELNKRLFELSNSNNKLSEY